MLAYVIGFRVLGFRVLGFPVLGIPVLPAPVGPKASMLPGLIAVRALHFWSVAVLLGGGGFLVLVGAGRVPLGTPLLRLASGIAAVTAIGWFSITFITVTGGIDGFTQWDVWSDFLTSPFGPPWAVQLMLSVMSAGLCAIRRPLPFVLSGAAFAVDQAWLGHAATGAGLGSATMIASYIAHVIAGLGWVGALTMLCAVPRSSDAMRDGLALFSTLGLFAVATILASGCLNAAFHMGRFADLTATPYGRIVLSKVALFAAMLGLATFNRREGHRDEIDARHVALGVGLETVLGLAVLAAAAALGVTAPAI